ncbi:MAG: hypothetical protein PHO08_14725 [Methylococcales bacterium]|nr:hypothetical protein [Methylococcales bacterium]MDD5633348.1 hypothetical protein [Methylococcales bacterium]
MNESDLLRAAILSQGLHIISVSEPRRGMYPVATFCASRYAGNLDGIQTFGAGLNLRSADKFTDLVAIA